MTPRDLPPPLRPLDPASGSGVGPARDLIRDQGLEPMVWSNGPGYRYTSHMHATTKLLVCAEGSITFLVGGDSVPVELRSGQGFELPPGTWHAAEVGPEGCTCVEGHRP